MQMTPASREMDDELLRGPRLLRSSFLSREERYVLEKALVSSRPVNAHVALVREREHTDNLFLIIEGWACRYTTTREGGRQISALLVPGDFCNLDSLLFDRLDCGVWTLTPATIIVIPRASALALATEYAGIARTFTWLAFVENAILAKLTLALGRRSAKGRLAHLLCELSARLGVEQDDESSFEFPLTQEQIGDALGLTSVHISRTMQLLRVEGLVETANRTMTLRSVAKLSQMGGFNPSYLHIERTEVVSTPPVTYPKSLASRGSANPVHVCYRRQPNGSTLPTRCQT